MRATTKIVGKFQVTVPPEFRELFDLREGDLFQWSFDERNSEIRLVPQRPQSITPVIRQMVGVAQKERAKEPVLAASGKG